MDCWNMEMILEAFKKDNVRETLELHEMSNSSFLLWPKPKMEDFHFLSHHLRRLSVSKVLSVGAGSGLFEWALESISGIECVALELDRRYWKATKRPRFKDQIFTDDPELEEIIAGKGNAILFSYFNDYKHFFEYLERFEGKVLVIVGPEVKGRYCMPTPFDPMIPQEWHLSDSKEISSTKDFISIYTRECNQIN